MPYHYDSRNYDPNAEFERELIPPAITCARWRRRAGTERRATMR